MLVTKILVIQEGIVACRKLRLTFLVHVVCLYTVKPVKKVCKFLL